MNLRGPVVAWPDFPVKSKGVQYAGIAALTTQASKVTANTPATQSSKNHPSFFNSGR